jgi:hypothetical protein
MSDRGMGGSRAAPTKNFADSSHLIVGAVRELPIGAK